MGFVSMILGWVLCISATLFWIGRSVWQLFKTDLGFFAIALPNFGFWILQIIVGIIFIIVGLAKAGK